MYVIKKFFGRDDAVSVSVRASPESSLEVGGEVTVLHVASFDGCFVASGGKKQHDIGLAGGSDGTVGTSSGSSDFTGKAGIRKNHLVFALVLCHGFAHLGIT